MLLAYSESASSLPKRLHANIQQSPKHLKDTYIVPKYLQFKSISKPIDVQTQTD